MATLSAACLLLWLAAAPAWESMAREAAVSALERAWAREGSPIVRTTPTAAV
jgi:hypothetical protein